MCGRCAHAGSPYTTSPPAVPMYTSPWLTTAPLYVTVGSFTLQSSAPESVSYPWRTPVDSGTKATPPATAAAEYEPFEVCSHRKAPSRWLREKSVTLLPSTGGADPEAKIEPYATAGVAITHQFSGNGTLHRRVPDAGSSAW